MKGRMSARSGAEESMGWSIEIASGARAGERVFLEGGARVSVGSSTRADIALGGTDLLARHFVLHCDEAGSLAIESAGAVALNGQSARGGALHHGDWLRAGEMDFVIEREGAAFAPDAGTRIDADPARRAALDALTASGAPLFAVLDAARDHRIRLLLRSAREPSRSLFAGEPALAAAAPHLVALPADGRLLVQLVAAGWGQSWGVFLRSTHPLERLARALAALTSVRLEGIEGRTFFRFYDPRVLRVFLPLATDRQRATFFRAAECFLLEDARGALVAFR
jgi:hypothetical protein